MNLNDRMFAERYGGHEGYGPCLCCGRPYIHEAPYCECTILMDLQEDGVSDPVREEYQLRNPPLQGPLPESEYGYIRIPSLDELFSK